MRFFGFFARSCCVFFIAPVAALAQPAADPVPLNAALEAAVDTIAQVALKGELAGAPPVAGLVVGIAREGGEAISRRLLGIPEPEILDLELSGEEWVVHLGSYDIDVLQICIFEEDGQLMAQLTLHQGGQVFSGPRVEE